MADEKETNPSPISDELFNNLTLDDKGKAVAPSTGSPPVARRAPPRPENVPPGARRGPPPNHRPRPSGPSGGPNSPPRRPSGAGRLRGPERPLTEEEKKKRAEYYERKRREGSKKKSAPVRAHRDRDVIDKLDETNPFGLPTIHHAGPYDAVLTSRNKATNKHAPMSAFPKDSVNMSLGGSGPINKRPDHAAFMGNNDGDATADFGTSHVSKPSADVAIFDAHQRASVIHGDESVGLGTSTFLEGTPAAKAAVEKAQQESMLRATMEAGGGLQRKKSLAQRIGIRPQRPGFSSSGRMTNPEGVYYRDRPSGGSMSSPRGENNPFFSEYEPNKDGEEQISVRRTNGGADASDSKPPLPGSLERRVTADSISEQPKPKGGLLGRMKSLKGGPRTRPVDKDYV
ncbi:unnamed protein product [Discula destructiva]